MLKVLLQIGHAPQPIGNLSSLPALFEGGVIRSVTLRRFGADAGNGSGLVDLSLLSFGA
jgi:hypothetical protein